jgi:hypothetical protein
MSCAGIKTYNPVGQARILQFIIQLFTKLEQLTQIQWTKIKKEVPIDKFVVDAEIVYFMNGWIPITRLVAFLLDVSLCR